MFDLIVALGNPGNQYTNTRHNIGWQLVEKHDELSKLGYRKKFKGIYAEAKIGSQKVMVLLPQTYMNLSGESVQEILTFYKFSPEKMIVLHDDLDLPFGRMQFKMGGGLAGHNGLKSIVANIGTEKFARMRLGIGRPTVGSVSDWVLSEYSKDQKTQIEQYLSNAAKALDDLLLNPWNDVYKRYLNKDLI